MSPAAHRERSEELLSGLNEPQREAVTHGEGPLLILAGAGSGKTRVLTHRIAFQIFTGSAAAGEILAITFTNRAAREMRERVHGLLGREIRGMWLMTFHAACARMLRSHADRLGYTRSFTIYDQADSRRLVKRCIDELGLDSKRYTPAAIQGQISAAKNRLDDAESYRRAISGYFEQTVADVYDLYERDLVRCNAMDFDDLLFRTVNLLELFADVRDRYASSFRHILVDEYQDTNHAQYRLLGLLLGGGAGRAQDDRDAGRPQDRDDAGRAQGEGEDARSTQQRSGGERAIRPGHRNLTVVGDDAQSIYGFRGADVRNILDFQEDYPDATVVRLEQNYRSTQTILSAANAVISHNRGGMSKALWSDLGEGEAIHVRELEDEHGEARSVVGEIQRLVDEGASRSEIAVFYRTNAMSRVLEDALVRREVAYQVVGGTKFYERAEIKDAIAYLTLVANPQDVVSFTRIVNMPRRGIGQSTLARVLAHAGATGENVWDTARAADRVPGLGAAAIKALDRFMDTMDDLRERAGLGEAAAETFEGGGVGDLLETVLAATGYVEALEAERSFEAQGRIENLQELVQVAREFDAGATAREGLDAFLEQVSLVSDSDPQGDDQDTAVTLMTLHNAKGLEFETVFIIGCEDGVFPHSRALDEGGLEEERRLFYVGVTRAMRELYLTYARRRVLFGAPAYGLRSRFLDEVPVALTDAAGDGGTRSPEPDRVEVWGQSSSGPPSVRRSGALGVRVGHGLAGRRGGPAEDLKAIEELSFRLGDDLLHADFGEGVVTGVEPGGVIVVRFARDRSERKLMAEYAPLTRRG